ncbi:hypothetical protein UVI_02041800 [Ustilaginoidea virens]|nr:hypothetical protein UVI_02041800 [Ustilaginoidea virens]
MPSRFRDDAGPDAEFAYRFAAAAAAAATATGSCRLVSTPAALPQPSSHAAAGEASYSPQHAGTPLLPSRGEAGPAAQRKRNLAGARFRGKQSPDRAATTGKESPGAALRRKAMPATQRTMTRPRARVALIDKWHAGQRWCRRRRRRPPGNVRADVSKRFQWGYLRHQSSGTELLSVRKAFNAWKARFRKLASCRERPRPWKRNAEWLLEHAGVAGMRAAWRGLDEQSRRKQWPLVMLSAMSLDPGRAVGVLDATLDPWPPGYAINDVLLFAARHLRQREAGGAARERALRAEETMDVLRRIVSGCPAGHVPFSQRVFGLFAKALPGAQARELYELLRASRYKLHANTLIQFASNLAAEPAHKDAALGILKGLSDAGADLSEARPSSVITSLLHCKAPEGGEAEQQQPSFTVDDAKAALEYFIERGFTLNVLSSTAFLDSLCQHGEAEEAIRLALLFSESGVRLDPKAWRTLFRGAKASLSVDAVARAVDVAKLADVPLVDVLDNTLHSVFYFAEAETRERGASLQQRRGAALFATLLGLYAKRFDLEPLQWWLPDSLPFLLGSSGGGGGGGGDPAAHQEEEGLAPSATAGGRPPRPAWDFERTIVPLADRVFSAGTAKLQPSLTSVAILLRAYIRGLQQPYDLLAYYGFFKSRLEDQARNPSLATASQLVRNQGTLIHDTLILAMTEHRGLTRPALAVLGDMLKDQLRPGPGPAPAPARVHPAPTVLTFSILLRGLMHNREAALAEQVLQVMRENGLQPNLVTWNTLTKGYASMQDLVRTVGALQDMEAAGLQPDIYTFRAFGKLRNQGRALEMMEHMIDDNMRKMEQDAGVS